MFAADVDGDGYVDVLSASVTDDRITWYENRLSGDADDDGEVAFADFLLLSANFGKTDAVWANGDFDADGKVEFADFLILSVNFGNTRLQLELANSSEDALALELPTANASAADEFFERRP